MPCTVVYGTGMVLSGIVLLVIRLHFLAVLPKPNNEVDFFTLLSVTPEASSADAVLPSMKTQYRHHLQSYYCP